MCFLLFTQISVTEADYDFIIHFYEFHNPLGLQCGECGSGGPPGCCDDVQRRENCNTTKPFTCDTRFRFILRPFGASLETAPNHTSFPHITRGKDNNSYTFSEGPQGFLNLHNPFVITMRGQWLVSSMLYMHKQDNNNVYITPTYREGYSFSLMHLIKLYRTQQ